MSTIHDRLRQARKTAGFSSARSAALHFGWKPSTYAAHENGQNSLNAANVKTYADCFKASVTWLITGVDRHLSGGVIPIVGQISTKTEIQVNVDPERSEVPGLWADDDLLSSFAVVPFRPRFLHLGFEVRGNALWPQHLGGDLIVTAITLSLAHRNEELIVVRKGKKPFICYNESIQVDFDAKDQSMISGSYIDLAGSLYDDQIIEALPIHMIIKPRGWYRVTNQESSWSTSINTFQHQKREWRERDQ